MSRFLSDKYAALDPYTPGEQPRGKKFIKLNTNESPYPPSNGVIDAIEGKAESLRLYCDPTCTELRAAISENYGVSAENIYLANGSDDILNFAFAAFGQNGVAYPEISYGFYSVFAKLYDIKTTEIPLKTDFSIDPSDYFGLDRLIVIANPNAPTGIALSPSEIEPIIKSNPDNIVVIDEAYVDFGGESCLPLIVKYDNLLVVRTYSKSRSMAGARLGYAFGSEAIISDLERLKYSTNPYNVNTLTQLAGTAAMKDEKYYLDNCKRIIETREYTTDELKKLGFEVLESKANFIFAKSDRISGEDLYLALKEKGVLVRHFGKAEITQYNRISIGAREDMEAFISTVKEILK